MSKIKNGGVRLVEPFEQQQFKTAGVEGVNSTSVASRTVSELRRLTGQNVAFESYPVPFNPLKGSGGRWLHFEVFSAIQV